MEYEIRPAQARELDALMALVGEAQRAIARLGIDQWQDGFPPRELIAHDIALGRLYVACDAQGPCALAAFCLGDERFYAKINGAWRANGPYLTVHRFAAGDRARGKGAAAMLMQKAEALARAGGCASVRLDTHRGNVAMLRFLEKHGYEYCGLVDYTPETAGDPLRAAYEKPME